MGIVRAEIIARMRRAFTEGISASRFIKDMKAVGLSYRRTDMLADWRDVAGLKRKEGAARAIRKGYVPAAQTVHLETWNMSQEYMYVLEYKRRMYAGEAVKPMRVNLMSDVPLTVEEIEQQAWQRAFDQSPPIAGEEREFMLYTAVRRVAE